MSRSSFRADLRRIVPLAWPVFIGQIAVLAFATVDTFLLARFSAIDLAALAVGMAVYISVFIGLMGVVLAVSPIVGRLFGAGQLEEAGRQMHQAVWLALILSVLGDALLFFPAPLLSIAHAGPEVESRVRDYLLALAFALPPALVFTVFRGFSTAISRPKTVMKLQVAGLLVKIPLSALLVWGAGPIPALGTLGCGIATAIVMWVQCGAGLWLLKHDAAYDAFGLRSRSGLDAPHWKDIRALLRLGVPMGASIAVEVTGFAFMAIFIARLGPIPVAGHELAMNLCSMMFMMPMAIGSAAGTLVAQAIGARDHEGARRVSNHSMELGLIVAAVMGALVFVFREQVLRLYTHDMSIVNAAMPLLLWLWIFHTADAVQTVAAQILRAYHVATAPVVIYALAIWGVGIGGGYTLAFSDSPSVPASLHGAPGFWSATTVGLVVAALGLTAFMRWMHRQQP